MTTLTVNTSFDFSNALLSNITLLDFTNPAVTIVPATATFSSSQFQTGQLAAALAVDGSSGINAIAVKGGAVDASLWSFTNWAARDRITLTGSAGADGIIGSVRSDTINGGGGSDSLEGGGGSNRLNGGQGDDHIVSSATAGADIINGGDGSDFAFIDRTQSAVSLAIDLGFGGINIGDGTKLTSIERLKFLGGSGNDSVTGGGLDDVLNGQDGDDFLKGAGGNDRIFTDAGVDTLNGDGGDDELGIFSQAGHSVIDGGTGSDKLYVVRENAAIALSVDIGDGGGGRDIGDGTTITNVESVDFRGGSGNDTARGGALNDIFTGNLGNDTLFGRGGADKFILGSADGADAIDGGGGIDTALLLYDFNSANAHILSISDGGGGRNIGDGTTLIRIEALFFQGGVAADKVTGGAQSDALRGGGGNDVLKGGGGDDAITGGAGRDTLAGNAGADTFVFKILAESAPGAQRDKIIDFVSGTDHIDLNTIGLPIDFIGTAGFGGNAGELRFATTATQTIVSWDTDGNGTADFQIALNGVLSLTAADFGL